MKRLENLLAVVLGLLLVAAIAGSFLTREPAAVSRIVGKSGRKSLVDDRLMQTVRQMAALANTTEEQDLALEAVREADHELDQAFASALRDATAAAQPVTGPLKQLADRITLLKAQIAADQERAAKLAGDQQELAKAQIALQEDELEDAQQDLVRQGGDQRAKLQRALKEYEALQHVAEMPKISPAPSHTTLYAQSRWYLALGDKLDQLEAARAQAANKAERLGRAHNTLEKLLNNQTLPAEVTPAWLARLRGLSDKRKTLTAYDKRIEDSQQLADVYKRWSAVVETRRRSALHLLLGSLAAVLAVLLAVVGITKAIHHAFHRQTDPRRTHQLRVIAAIVVQAVGALVILMIIFGMPTQTSTMIGLATAGVTVALRDFIIAFFGWFVLMGRNGIRVGDWVEINGVSGEVIEIGLLRTVLLEMGSQINAGHPTGRKVAFVNSFAIEGHYFNFSTGGQWLRDELQVSLPQSGDPYQMAQQIRQTVERETEADAKAAEQDWERVTHQYGSHPFSAKPTVDLRPSATGLDVVVRYIAKAPQRHQVKSHLFEEIITLLHKPEPAAP